MKDVDVRDSIRELIEQGGFRQCAIAKKAGLSENQLSGILTKKRGLSANELFYLCRALNTTPDSVYHGKNRPA